ncbi:MAG: GIY-YIG nuclease family protein [Planctomycetes bacterium]|nr:GIY-YIG nuclease family protein [Planctomycetota bacterium]
MTTIKKPAVYMMASKRNGKIYVGVTSNLLLRVWQHREEVYEGWTKIHGVKILVWYEWHDSMVNAIRREKAIKKWVRRWKVNAINSINPEWVDLYEKLLLNA